MPNPILAKSHNAEAAIPAYRLVKLGAAVNSVVLAAAATDLTCGVSHEVTAAIGERVDVNKIGIAYVEAGAPIARGAPITSDGTGRGVTAAPAAGANNRIVGFAEEAAAAAGDIINVLLAPGYIQG